MNNLMWDLSQLTINQFNILNNIEENEGEAIPEDLISFDNNMGELKKQYQNLYYYVKHTQGEIDTIKKEKNRLQELINSKENAIKKIKDFMLSNLKTLHEKDILIDEKTNKKPETPKIKTDTITIFVVKKDDYKCEIDKTDYEEIVKRLPEEFKEIEIVEKPKLNELSKAYSDGRLVNHDGIQFTQTEYVSWR
jgi:hypothetical protein